MIKTKDISKKPKRIAPKGEKKIRMFILGIAIFVGTLGFILGVLTYCQVI